MSYSVFYSTKAQADLNSIYSYIAFTLNESETANAMFSVITEAIDSLEDMPLRHPPVDREPHKSRQIRKLPVKNYLVFYKADKEKQSVEIVRIMYGGRDFDRHL